MREPIHVSAHERGRRQAAGEAGEPSVVHAITDPEIAPAIADRLECSTPVERAISRRGNPCDLGCGPAADTYER